MDGFFKRQGLKKKVFAIRMHEALGFESEN
jgi:hypothetical protein